MTKISSQDRSLQRTVEQMLDGSADRLQQQTAEHVVDEEGRVKLAAFRGVTGTAESGSQTSDPFHKLGRNLSRLSDLTLRCLGVREDTAEMVELRKKFFARYTDRDECQASVKKLKTQHLVSTIRTARWCEVEVIVP